MALKRAKCNQNDVKIASFLLQNQKKLPSPPSAVTIYLMIMPPFVTCLSCISWLSTKPKSDNFCAKIYLSFTPLSKILIACLVTSSVARRGAGGTIALLIGLSTKMQNKKKYHIFSSYETVFFALELTKQWFKSSFEHIFRGGGANLSKIKVTNQ